jgi:hypothetical protein
MRRILCDSPCASKRFFCASFALALLFLLVACQSKVQNTSIDIGGGMRKGDPPMCFQYRTEARATMRAYDLFLHVNNSCRYPVDCVFRDDVSEQERRVVQPANHAESYVIVENVQVKRLDVDAECTWKP